jgi:hypothetical protein
MAMNNIAQWIDDSVKNSDSQWLALVFRADGLVTNGHQVRQSPWSKSATCSIELLKTALSWTITECRRKHYRQMKFVSYLGGEPIQGTHPHIHAIIEIPAEVLEGEFLSYVQELWSKKLKKKFKQFVPSAVLSQPLKSSTLYAYYSSRYEGSTFNAGDEKVIINNSFYL